MPRLHFSVTIQYLDDCMQENGDERAAMDALSRQMVTLPT